jgi:hypothetical protein
MFKGSFQPDDVFFVFWIGLLEFLQHLRFLETSFVPRTRIRGGGVRVWKSKLTWILGTG